MRVIVLGATGYVGSRLVPYLVRQGHDVVAASSSEPTPHRFGWGKHVEAVRCDVTDADSVADAVRRVDAVVYLVHSLDRSDFSDRDRRAAENVRDAIAAHPVTRLVYLSGLVPDAPEEELSEHITSRLEVERILLQAPCPAVALRAGVVIGAGSTSFEIIRQVARLLVVQPVPMWMRSKVQPVAVSDVVRALAEMLTSDVTGSLDVGADDVVAYPRLMQMVGRESGLRRLPIPTPVAPISIVGLATALLTTAPFHTVTALIDSLKHDMVCRPDHTWTPADGSALVSLRDAIRRAADPNELGPEGPAASDAPWTKTPALVRMLPLPTTTKAAAGVALHRARELRR